jgi:chloramphenicol 3-O phosphotransferase
MPKSPQVIVLNGSSSSGKTSLARSLQTILPEPWLTFGVDTLIEAMPASMQTLDAGIVFGSDGLVTTGAAFQVLDNAWSYGIAAMARTGARVIVDEVFLGGEKSQLRWKTALQGLEVLWVAVRCDLEVANARELLRGNRVQGMAEKQAEIVHKGVHYDLEVDTTTCSSLECAKNILVYLK